MHRHGWSVQVTARRALERDEEAIVAWKEQVRHMVKHRGGPGRLRVFRGRARARPEAAEWTHLSAGGARPVTVRGRGSGRVNWPASSLPASSGSSNAR
ncbi:winged helix-turn-helix domain-containing protein [Nonomuraea sp. NPDC048892]|uniref:winged helix-turn-helix domain-containing protein n=1 Tax=Nonomuraea sp. NPDC048892 TaxID=3154624 RepID=UPI0033E56264